MYLKRIALTGFKSFAEQTEILFDHEVTGIVGPNGCGKSNIVDAFRWVMGEQSAKSMRGDKMLDVIFAGTTTRRLAESAEVAITFSEVGDALPVPYEEVEVSRRINRAGESEYRLNGQVVRQRDVHSLFWDSGLGKDAFAIFEQGKVEEIVLLSPQERRQIFDQVAGIKRFRERRKEAVRKLAQMEGNLTRLKDLLREESKQLRGLEKQVAEAATYRERQSRVQELQQCLLYTRWAREERQRAEVSQKLAQVDATLREQRDRHAQEVRRQQEMKAEMADRELRLRALTERWYALRSASEVQEARRQSLQHQLEQTRGRRDALTQQVTQQQTREQERAQAIAERERSIAEWQQDERERKASLESTEGLAAGVQHEVEALREQQAASHQHRDALVSALHSATGKVRECRIRLEAMVRRENEWHIEQEELAARLEHLAQQIEEKRAHVGELSQALDRRKSVLRDVAERFTEKRAESKEVRQNLEQLVMSLAEQRARQKVLRRMQQEQEGLSQGARTLLEEFGGALLPLHQAVSPSAGLEAAAASVLGHYGATLVARSNAVLQQAIQRGRELALTDLSLASMPVMEGLVKALDVVPLEELVEGTVSAEGHYLDLHGVYFFPVRGERSTLVREAELKELAAKTKEGEARTATLEATLAGLTEKSQSLRTERDRLDLEQRREEMKLVETNFSLQQLLATQEEATKRAEQIDRDKEKLVQQRCHLAEELKFLEEVENRAQSELETHKGRSQSTEAGLEEALSRLRAQQLAVREKDMAYRGAVQASQEVVRELAVLRARSQESAKESARLEKELAKTEHALEALSHELHVPQEETAGKKAVEKAKEQVGQAEAELVTCRERLRALDAEMGKKGQREKEQESKAHQLEVQIATLDSRMEGLEVELRERFALSMDDLAGNALTVSLEEAEREVADLRHKLGSSDTVNLGAIEEFKEKKKGHAHLAEQVEDLVQGQRELQKMIQQMDRTSRKKFRQSFERVRTHFHEQFQTLFAGGEADLQFTDGGDVLEAGIEIVARPPGKQLRSISLLSGGEKCLTAMALLFAFFQVKPAPFCILDEMDAPLDDSNIRRFLNLLAPLLPTTQFIIVTHNKQTMAVADRLVGVSMEHKGVSKLISIAFEGNRSEGRHKFHDRVQAKGAAQC